jgi:hypothetical protein
LAASLFQETVLIPDSAVAIDRKREAQSCRIEVDGLLSLSRHSLSPDSAVEIDTLESDQGASGRSEGTEANNSNGVLAAWPWASNFF